MIEYLLGYLIGRYVRRRHAAKHELAPKQEPFFGQDAPESFRKACADLRHLPDLPFLLTHPVAGLLQSIDADEPIAAVWFLKDAAESTLKTCFTVSAAEILRLSDDRGSDWLQHADVPDELSELASFIRYSQGMTMGSLLFALEQLVLPQVMHTPEASLTRELAALWSRKPSPHRGLEALRKWRNEYHGHGSLGNRRQAAQQVHEQLPTLAEVVNLLAPCLTRLKVARETEFDQYGHVPSTVDMLVSESNPQISLRPLLEFLAEDGDRTVAILDKTEERKNRLQYRPAIVGSPTWIQRSRIPGPQIGALEQLARSPSGRGHREGAPEESLLELGWLQHQQGIRFANYEAGIFIRPGYLIEQIERILRGVPSGALRIDGPAGCGKSYLARSVVDHWRAPDSEPRIVLPFAVLPRQGMEQATFLFTLTAETAAEVHRLQARGTYLRIPREPPVADPARVREWLLSLRAANPSCRGIYLVIDGLDEIQSAGGLQSLTALLPRSLDDGVYLVLLGRTDDELDVHVRRDLQEFAWASDAPIHIRTEPSDPTAAENKRLLNEYLKEFFGEFNSQVRTSLIHAANGRFLYLDALATGVRHGAFEPERLPPPDEVLEASLKWLLRQAHRVPGYSHAIRQVISYLAIAAIPVPQECLLEWGVDPRFIEQVLLDLKGLLARERRKSLVQGTKEPYVYRIYHREFLNRLYTEPEWKEELCQTNARLLNRMVRTREGLWHDQERVSWDDPADAYAMLALGHHLRLLQQFEDSRSASAVVDTSTLLSVAWRLHFGALLHSGVKRLNAALECSSAARGLYDPERTDYSEKDLSYFAGVFSEAVTFHADLHQYREAKEAAETGLRLARLAAQRSGKREGTLGRALQALGRVSIDMGDVDSAQSYFSEAVQIARELMDQDDPGHTAHDFIVALRQFAGVLEQTGDLNNAQRTLREAVSLSLRAKEVRPNPGTRRDYAVSALLLGRILTKLKSFDEAREHLTGAVQSQMEVFNEAADLRSGDVAEITTHLLRNQEELTGKWAAAIEVYKASITGFHATIFNLNVLTIEALGDMAVTLMSLGNLDYQQQSWEVARNCYTGSAAIYFRLVVVAPAASPALLGNYASALLDLGRVHLKLGSPSSAQAAFRAGLEALQQHQQLFGESKQTRGLSTLLQQACAASVFDDAKRGWGGVQ